MNTSSMSVEDSKKWYKSNKTDFISCANEISILIEKILKQKGIIFHSISSRVKEEDSFLEKCNKDKYKNPIAEIKDLVGIRIIGHTNIEVNKICKIIKEEFDIDVNNSVNKADNLDEDKVGYLSVHYVASLNCSRRGLSEYSNIKDLCFEIQIRTLLQHTWAEIEHDKSYKFSGELRKDLKRSFYLIAGVLELVDKEFERLSEEIDLYAIDVSKKTQDGNYNITIDSTSLQEYMKSRFGEFENVNRSVVSNIVIEELKRFGISTLKDVEDIIPSNYNPLDGRSYNGILRQLMIINNSDKYFNQAFDNGWGYIERISIDAAIRYGVDIEHYVRERGIEII